MRRSWMVLVFLLPAVLLMTLPVQAQNNGEGRTINVSGEATVRVEPDMGIVRFGVVTHAEDPEEAREQNAEASREALNAVRELGVDERRIRMEVLRLQPRRVYNREQRRYEEEGFEAIRIVVVELDDLEQLPVVVAEVVQRGANRLEQVRYDLRDRNAPRNEALRDALTNARDKARLMAETLDVELGPVRQIREQQLDFPRPMVRMDTAMAAEAAGPEPEAFAAGEIEVRATVQVVFELH